MFGGEINYQKDMGANRLELGGMLDFKSSEIFGSKYNIYYFGAVGIYHWKWNDLGGVSGLNWYAGPGAAVQYSMWSYNINYMTGNQKDSGGDIWVNVGGQVGIEFNFDAPWQISLDIRPMFGLLNKGGFGYGTGLGIRYRL
jgi:hypothetical protein